MLSKFCLQLLVVVASTLATPILYDGRAPFNLTGMDLNNNIGPYFTVVKGTQNATHYSSLLGHTQLPTPLWNEALILPREQVISISIDNTSIFTPGTGVPDTGFRRTEFIAAENGDHNDLNLILDKGITVFHVSIKQDERRPLNFNHEYQIVFIEPPDGSQVFKIQLGSPFTNPTGPLPAPNAHSFKVLDHALNVLFTTPFTPNTWHNFAVQVDWTNRTLAVLFSNDDLPLRPVTKPAPNPTTPAGSAGQGDYHFGALKLPLVNPADSPADQGDVVHFGIQEGTTEGLLYSGVFVEDASHGISLGHGLIAHPF